MQFSSRACALKPSERRHRKRTFDREVIPAGTIALGKVSRTQLITKWQRVRAILNGDFTPLRSAQVEFTSLKLPDGHQLSTPQWRAWGC